MLPGQRTLPARVIGDLPSLLAGSVKPQFGRFMDAIAMSRPRHIRELMIDLRAALEAGTATSNSLNAHHPSLISWWQVFEKPSREPRSRATSPGNPFDITEYTAAAAEITRARDPNSNADGRRRSRQPGAGASGSEHATRRLRERGRSCLLAMAQLIGVLIVGGLGAALVYRMAARRWLT